MKTFLLLALLVLAAISAAIAQSEDFGGENTHEKQCQEGQAMDACRAYLKEQCTASTMPITWPRKWRMGSCRALRQRCCKQLEQMPPSCRCKAICRTVQEVEGSLSGSKQGRGHQMMGKVRQMAKTLPSPCNMYPSYCNIPTTGGCCY